MKSVNGSGQAEREAKPGGRLVGLRRAATQWGQRGDASGLVRWLDRELDEEGVPRRLAVEDWSEALAILADARRRRPSRWPVRLDARVEGLLGAALRFARPGGAPVFGPDGVPPGRRELFRDWADRLSDPALSTVLDLWQPGGGAARRRAVPPLPAQAREDRPLAILRPDWMPKGDFLAVDHRDRAAAARVELFGLGKRWLGPTWGGEEPADLTSNPRPLRWHSDSQADLAEWSFRTADARVTRTALLLRGQNLALLAEQVERREPADSASLRLELAPGVSADPLTDCRALRLSSSAGRGGSARVLPIALPALPYPTEKGRLGVEGRELVLRQRVEGKRHWLPLLVSWRPARDSKAVAWRTLTVTERSKPCGPAVAVAYRVAWGRGESLVIYRSLAGTARRAFLGHLTEARFLVGLFSTDGDLKPILKVDA